MQRRRTQHRLRTRRTRRIVRGPRRRGGHTSRRGRRFARRQHHVATLHCRRTHWPEHRSRGTPCGSGINPSSGGSSSWASGLVWTPRSHRLRRLSHRRCRLHRRRLHRRLHRHRHRPPPPTGNSRGSRAACPGRTGAAAVNLQWLGCAQMVVGVRGGVAGTAGTACRDAWKAFGRELCRRLSACRWLCENETVECLVCGPI